MPADYKGRLYLLLTGCCPPKLQTSLINSIFIGCGRATRWVGERDNSPKGILENTGQRRWLGVSGGNPIHGLSSCVKVHRQKAQLGTTFPLLLLLAIQKRTQYLCYRLLKKKWKWRIVLGQDRTVGPKLSLFSKMFDWITGSLNWERLFFRLLLKCC